VIEIRNLTFQPLTFHLAGDSGGIHLGSREKKTIGDDQLSGEIRTAAERGFISIADVSKRTQPDPLVETTVGEHSSEFVDNQPRHRKRRER
jgi:hypothetical protein